MDRKPEVYKKDLNLPPDVEENMRKLMKSTQRTEFDKLWACYGDVREKEKKPDVTALLALLIMLQARNDLIYSEGRELPEAETPEFLKKLVRHSQKPHIEMSYRIADDAVRGMENGNLGKMQKVLNMMPEIFGKVSLEKDENALPESERILNNESWANRAKNENLMQFLDLYFSDWLRFSFHEQNILGKHEPSEKDLPLLSFNEYMEEGKDADEWIRDHKKKKPQKPESTREEKERAEILAALLEAFKGSWLLNEEPAERMLRFLKNGDESEKDPQAWIIQSQTVVLGWVGKWRLEKSDVLKEAAKNHPVIARRAVKETQKANIDGPNFSILRDLVQAWWLFAAAKADANVLAEILEKNEEEYKRYKEHVEETIEKHNEEVKKLNEEREEFEKNRSRTEQRIKNLEEENERLQKQVFELSRELEFHDAKAAKKEEAENKSENEGKPEPTKESKPETPKEPEEDEKLILPSDEEVAKKLVVVAGGYRAVTYRLKEKFPEWRYISADEARPHIPENAELVVFFSNFMPHKLYNPCMSACRKWGIPACYAETTDLERTTELVKETLAKREKEREEYKKQGI